MLLAVEDSKPKLVKRKTTEDKVTQFFHFRKLWVMKLNNKKPDFKLHENEDGNSSRNLSLTATLGL